MQIRYKHPKKTAVVRVHEPGERKPKHEPKQCGRKICKICAYRSEQTNSTNGVCMCMAETGVPRDKNATDTHCATYKRRGGGKPCT